MTQACSFPPSTANVKASYKERLPKGIHVTGANNVSAPGIEGMSRPEELNKDITEDTKPWGYLLIHNKQVELFKKQVDAYNHSHPTSAHRCFIHYSIKHKPKNNGHGVVKKYLPTISGLVFLQGETKELQRFLHANHPQYHLVNNCSTGKPAIIADCVMRPFMEVVTTHPENVTFLRDPFVKFAHEHTKLRVLTGLFQGLEGYVVRVDRDRQLIMEFGGYAVAIRGVHNEDFEVAE